jgi:hypothetical protein
MSLLVGPKKYGYVEGRKIIYCIILQNEVVYTLKSSRTSSMLGHLKGFYMTSWMPPVLRSITLNINFSSSIPYFMSSLLEDWLLSLMSTLVMGFGPED